MSLFCVSLQVCVDGYLKRSRQPQICSGCSGAAQVRTEMHKSHCFLKQPTGELVGLLNCSGLTGM